MAVSAPSPSRLVSYYNLPRTGQTCKWSICPINQLQCLEKSSIIILQMFYPTFLTHSPPRPRPSNFSFFQCLQPLDREKLKYQKWFSKINLFFQDVGHLFSRILFLQNICSSVQQTEYGLRDVACHYIIPLHRLSDPSIQTQTSLYPIRQGVKETWPISFICRMRNNISLYTTPSRTFGGISTNHKVLPTSDKRHCFSFHFSCLLALCLV